MRGALWTLRVQAKDIIGRAKRKQGKNATALIGLWLAFIAAVGEVSRPSALWILLGALIAVLGFCLRMPARFDTWSPVGRGTVKRLRVFGLALALGPFGFVALAKPLTAISSSGAEQWASLTSRRAATTTVPAPGKTDTAMMSSPAVLAIAITAPPSTVGVGTVTCSVAIEPSGPDASGCSRKVVVAEFGQPHSVAAAWDLPPGATMVVRANDATAEQVGPTKEACLWTTSGAIGLGEDLNTPPVETVLIDRMSHGATILLFTSCTNSDTPPVIDSGWVLTIA